MAKPKPCTSPGAPTTYRFKLELFDEKTGAVLTQRPVPGDLLHRCREGMIFDAQRKGLIGDDGQGAAIHEEPRFAGDRPGQIAGVRMSLGEGTGQVARELTLVNAFKPLADDILMQMAEAQQYDGKGRVLFRAYAEPAEPRPADAVTAKVRRAPLPLLPGQLDDLLPRAVAAGPMVEGEFPIFIAEDVLPLSVEKSWKGPDLEGGAWLVGHLYRQDSPREIYALIDAVIEAHGTKHQKDRIDLSTETHLHFLAQLERRRVRMGKVGEIPLGFIHSHPFLPAELDGHNDCRECDKRETCTVTSAFLSKRDAQFHAALFGAAPYAVQMVLGLTPRADFDLRMFCLDGCQFRERGFYALAAEPAAA